LADAREHGLEVLPGRLVTEVADEHS
jgi:hypothetical protein